MRVANQHCDQNTRSAAQFADAGAKFDAVGFPIRMQAAKGLVATIRNVHIESTKEKAAGLGKAR